MKHFSFVLSLFISAPLFASPSVEGLWTTIDDNTGKPRGQVELYRVGDELRGKVISIIDPQAKQVCEVCPAPFSGKPVQGLEFMWGLKEKEGTWQDGQILDPKTGDIYKSRVVISEDGQSLDVRGYTGFTLLGRSQTWVRKAQ